MTWPGKLPFVSQHSPRINAGCAKLVLEWPSTAFLGEKELRFSRAPKVGPENIQPTCISDGVRRAGQRRVHQERPHLLDRRQIDKICAHQSSDVNVAVRGWTFLPCRCVKNLWHSAPDEKAYG